MPRYEQDCCRHAAVAQERRCHEEAAECAAVLAGVLLVEERRRHEAGMRAKVLGTGRRHIPRAPSSSIQVPPPTHPNLLPGGGARAAASKALTLVEERHQHEAATRVALSAASSLAGRQPCQEVVLMPQAGASRQHANFLLPL